MVHFSSGSTNGDSIFTNGEIILVFYLAPSLPAQVNKGLDMIFSQ